MSFRRRDLLRLGVAGALGALLPRAALASARRTPRERVLGFLNLHTGERVEATYFAAGRYLPSALAEIDRVLRDHRSGEVKAIDVRLLDLLHRLGGALGTREPFHVISGYRSPATNAALAARSSGVAKGSLHVQGLAIDLRLPGRRLDELRRAALALRAGGVGYYPEQDFVHLDVGRVRFW